MKCISVHLSIALALLTVFIIPTATLAGETPTAVPEPAAASSDPLLGVLVSKGILSPDEARFVGSGATADQRDKLVLLLKEKGLLSSADLDALRPPASLPSVMEPDLRVANVQPSQAAVPAEKTEPPKPPAPAVIPAVAPLRVLQNDASKKDGLVPDIKLGTGARVKLYGMIKASTIYDSSSPYGTDMPLPGFLGVNGNSSSSSPSPSFDTGPTAGREFHVKARFARIGANFEWPEVSERWTLTGRLEFDFEGNFTRALNRNVSTIRSSMASIRLAWARTDYKVSDSTTWYALFGQDWTPFGSSTLPNLVETTGLALGYGTLYERAPQMRTGFVHVIGGDRKLTIIPEFAIVMPAFGNNPTNVSDQLGYGERQGADSGRPEIQGRFVTQWQLDKAPGVAPAQVITSFVQGSRKAILRASDVPLCPSPLPAFCGGNANFFKNAFPTGVEIDSSRWGLTGEIQLPTRWVTVIAKYWNGADLRWYFVGSLLSNYNDNTGLTNLVTSPSIDAASTVVFGTDATGAARVAPQKPVHAQGGFVNLGFPLSRIAGADPSGRNATWQFYLHYSYDEARVRDVRRTTATGAVANVRNKNDLAAGTLMWKLNPFVTLALEESYYRTRMAGGTTPWALRDTVPGSWPLWMGKPARSWHDLRSEFSTVFTF